MENEAATEEAAPGTAVRPPKMGVIRRLAPLRLAVFFLVLAAAYGLPQDILRDAAPHIAKDTLPWVALCAAMLTSLLTVSLYALLVGILERRHIIELGLKRGLPQCALGIVLAVLLFALIYVVLIAVGAAHWRGFAGTGFVLPMAALALASGICEEVIFRGGIFRITEDMFGTAAALIVSGAVFGLLHLNNPNATTFSSVCIAIEAGILLGAAYAVTRNLWFAIGLHIGWNFAEGGIFGAAVSGSKGGEGLFRIPLSGPDWLTGGAFGPEASVITLVICTAAGIYFVWRTIKEGRWCRAGFRMMLD